MGAASGPRRWGRGPHRQPAARWRARLGWLVLVTDSPRPRVLRGPPVDPSGEPTAYGGWGGMGWRLSGCADAASRGVRLGGTSTPAVSEAEAVLI